MVRLRGRASQSPAWGPSLDPCATRVRGDGRRHRPQSAPSSHARIAFARIAAANRPSDDVIAPRFRVRGKLFASVHLDGDEPSAIVHVRQEDAAAAVTGDRGARKNDR